MRERWGGHRLWPNVIYWPVFTSGGVEARGVMGVTSNEEGVVEMYYDR